MCTGRAVVGRAVIGMAGTAGPASCMTVRFCKEMPQPGAEGGKLQVRGVREKSYREKVGGDQGCANPGEQRTNESE